MSIITSLYQQLFGKNHIRDGDVISMSEHGRVGGLSTGQGFKHSSIVDKDIGSYLKINSDGLLYNPAGSATSANQQPPATTPTIYNLILTSANIEYSQLLPDNTKQVFFKCRTLYDVRYAWVTGKVATPTDPYRTCSAGMSISIDNLDFDTKTLYLASSQAGVIVEIEITI